MDLKSISTLGRIERKVELTKELSLTLHTLSALETQKCLAELPNSLSDASYRNVILQMALLVYSTSHIDNNPVTLEQAKEFYQNLQAPLFNAAAEQLEILNTEQAAVLEELKKK